MIRNNAVEIIRTVFEIFALHESKGISQKKGDLDAEVPWSDRISRLKAEPRCLLKRNHGERVHIDYYIERTKRTTEEHGNAIVDDITKELDHMLL